MLYQVIRLDIIRPLPGTDRGKSQVGQKQPDKEARLSTKGNNEQTIKQPAARCFRALFGLGEWASWRVVVMKAELCNKEKI